MNISTCDNTNCNGGRAFQIRDSMFCSPRCGNIHFNLSRGDEEYWPNEEQDQEEEEEWNTAWDKKHAQKVIKLRIASCDERITSFQEKIKLAKVNIRELLQLGSLLPNAILQPLLNIVENDENNIQLFKTEKLIYNSLLNPNTNKEIFKMLLAKYDELLSNSYDICGNMVREGNPEGEYIDYCKRSLVQRKYIRKMCCLGYGEDTL
jgi:hypothetical protein